MKLKALGNILTGAIIFSLLLLTGGSILIFDRIDKADSSWRTYQDRSSVKAQAIDSLMTELGYGGMIQQFMTAILRRDSESFEAIRYNGRASLTALHQYTHSDISEQETRAIADIENVINQYLQSLETIQDHISENHDAGLIDAALQINDQPALDGIQLLIATIDSSHLSVSGGVTKTELLSQIRFALGYGGMVHNFKNYILRPDQTRKQSVLDSADTSLLAISDFRSLGVTEKEDAALRAIEEVIEFYKFDLQHITDLHAENVMPEVIDVIVQIDDRPALNGLEYLVEAIAISNAREQRDLTESQNTVKRIALLSILVAVISCLLISIAAYWIIVSRITRPLTLAIEATEALSNGDTAARLVHSINDEFGVLSRVLDHFRLNIIRLRESEEKHAVEEEKARHTLIEHVEATDALNLELHRANDRIRDEAARSLELGEEAVQANKAKSEFLAIMSHELRTPMNGVLSVADLMLMSDLPEDARENIAIIKKSGETLLSLVNGILDLSKIEAGKIEIEQTEVDIVSLMGSVASLVNIELGKKGLWYRQDIDGDLVSPWIMADPTRIRQILTNLVSNAIKFTHEGGITLTLSQTAAGVGKVETRIEVRDTGIGLSEEKQTLIFEAFTQADQSTTRNYGGTGLGLTISKQLVEMLGGRIGLASEPGKGSLFWFTIVTDQGTGHPVADIEDAMYGVAGSSGPKERRSRLLVAEDNETNQIIIGKILGAFGFEFEMVGNGQEAVDAIAGGGFDLVLMDINMPVMGGLDATRLIRGLPDDERKIPIIALTANSMEGDRETCLAAGMDDFIPKPISPAALLQVIIRQTDCLQEDQTTDVPVSIQTPKIA